VADKHNRKPTEANTQIARKFLAEELCARTVGYGWKKLRPGGVQLLAANPEAMIETSLIEMLIQAASQKGRSQILVRSLEMSL
jgi:hypothetical protein